MQFLDISGIQLFHNSLNINAMKMDVTIQNPKKIYETPELKELGKLGEITNTTTSTVGADGGTAPNYNS